MNLEKRVSEILKDSTTKDLPLGSHKKRWKSGHRLSWRLNKPREKRADLKEHPTRVDQRIAQKDKKVSILKEAHQIHAFPMPRYKENKKIIDHQAVYKKLIVNPQTVTLTEEDLTKVTPEVLPLLGQKIRRLRSTGESWEAITLEIVKSYTSHLSDTHDKALKLGLVKNELRKQWNIESDAIKRANMTAEEIEKLNAKPMEPEILHPDLTEEWKLEDNASPHPNAAKYLRQHMALYKDDEKL